MTRDLVIVFLVALGIELEESLSGGGSDGNFTAAVGAPTNQFAESLP